MPDLQGAGAKDGANGEKEYELTRYEIVQAIGVRATQLARGAPPLINVDQAELAASSCSSSELMFDIARKELAAGRLPFKIPRTQPDGTVVYLRTWK